MIHKGRSAMYLAPEKRPLASDIKRKECNTMENHVVDADRQRWERNVTLHESLSHISVIHKVFSACRSQ